jgi:hypothetical protein
MSEIDTAAFFAAVHKAIACTRNHAPDERDYAAGVLEPVAGIRALEEELGDRDITRAEAEQVLGLLASTMRAKQVPDEEREHYSERIAESSGLALVWPTAAA